ncbi:colicin immunity protein Cui [Serratia rubidaea]|uniref:colicin immunity protein Cui n=1 Tax=Serratia rubidaea TaxID=61652 RepID=UPI0022B8E988|nr:colicin immunity protein Cui [Serratia rubidaea]WBF46785.1 colicin immunity protein [Serratia rubidaea]
MDVKNEVDEGAQVAKVMFLVLFVALLPFFFIIGIYVQDPTSIMLNNVASITSHLPAIHSLKSPLLSKVMDVYVKTSPFVAFVLFLITQKRLKLKKDNSKWYLLRVFILFSLFYTVLIYSFLFTNKELTNSAKILNLMSTNDIFLSFFYISLYCVIFLFTYLCLWFFIGTIRAFKERW